MNIDRTERILERMAKSEPIRLDSLDLAPRDADAVKRRLGATFTYFARVESEVAAEPLMALLPRLGSEYLGFRSLGTTFLDLWVAQERAHGSIFYELQRVLGLEARAPNVDVPVHNRIIGALGRLSPSVHAVFEMIYLSRGAMHEKLTFVGYNALADALDVLGEPALLETVIKPIRSQEAAHLAYYTTEAQRLRSHLHPWQTALARWISMLTYAPVGAAAPRDRAHFGEVAVALAGEDAGAMTRPIQALAEKLLSSQEHAVLPGFVARSIRRCVEQAQHRPAA